ncbi:hypothetical protein A2U01_0100442, partial [Trifolium medium]|nr:hypothetical protein [Trifolium medium]
FFVLHHLGIFWGNDDLTILHPLQYTEPFGVELDPGIEDLKLINGIIKSKLYTVEDVLPKHPDPFDELGT